MATLTFKYDEEGGQLVIRTPEVARAIARQLETWADALDEAIKQRDGATGVCGWCKAPLASMNDICTCRRTGIRSER